MASGRVKKNLTCPEGIEGITADLPRPPWGKWVTFMLLQAFSA